MTGIVFLVGGRYANRRGEYEVLSISGDKMLIRYDDGVIQEVSVSMQTRISQNMSLEASIASPYAEAQAERNQRYFKSLGFLSIRATMLEAIVPPHALPGFKRDYIGIKRANPIPGQEGFYIHDLMADKWGSELRITFAASENEKDALDFGPDVNIVFNPSNTNSWRINNNSFWWKLLKVGFEMGTIQNAETIRTNIPLHYRTDFDAGCSDAG